MAADPIYDPTPLVLRADDQPDLQALNVRLSELLGRADKTLADLHEILVQSGDLLDAHRLTRLLLPEARQYVAGAIKTREELGQSMRTAGLLGERWEVR